MKSRIYNWLNYNYPQNYILKYPFTGTLIIVLFTFGFTSLYKPFNVHPTKVLSFETTMAFYSFLSGIIIYLAVKTMKAVKYFSKEKEWTVYKEIISVLIILFVLGLAIYFLGFLIESEPTANRWNISTFLNSLGSAFLIGIIPLLFFSAINYRYLFTPVISYNVLNTEAGPVKLPPEDLIQISSQLKKEDLSFYPGEFLYAESDGNYVIFYLIRDNMLKKEIIRNSINSIEQQLSSIPYFFRTHRAFIVNLKKVRSKQGNSLGYVIKLTGPDIKLPVSRNNTSNFNRLFAEYHN
jgi:LytTr DNA-binding domain